MKGIGKIAAYTAAFILIISLFACFLFFRDVSVKVEAFVGPDEILIGDTVKYTLLVTAPEDAEIKLANIKRKLSDFTIRKIEVLEEDFFKRKTVKQVCLITKYEPGKYKIPQMEVRYRKKGRDVWERASTRAFFVSVKRLAGKKDLVSQSVSVGGSIVTGAGSASGAAAGRVMAGPIRYRINDIGDSRRIMTYKDVLRIAGFALGGLVLAGLAVFIIARIIKHRPQKPPLSVHEIAVKKLGQLKNKKLLERSLVREFCSELSSILIGYVQKRFGKDEREATAEEFAAEIDKIKELSPEQEAFLKERVFLCSRVRYSGYKPPEGELDPELKAEIRFVEETKEENADDRGNINLRISADKESAKIRVKKDKKA